MEQFDNIKCPTCGREYSGLLTTCPYCELGLDATTSLPKLTKDQIDTTPPPMEEEEPVIVWPDPVDPNAEKETQDQTRAWSTASPAPERETVQAVPVARQRREQEPEEREDAKVPGWLTALICVVLGVAILVGAFLLLRSAGIIGSTESESGETISPSLPVSSTPTETEDNLETSTSEPVVSEDLPEESDSASSEVVWPSDTDDETDDEASGADGQVITDDSTPTTETVDVECDSISLNLTDISLFNIGETYTFTVSVTPASASEYVTWESSDIAVCSVDDNGTVTAVNGGTAEITATCGDQTATCIVRCAFATVDLDQLFTLNYTDITMFYPGEEVQLSVTNLDDDSEDIQWESSDPSVATVEDGLVTAVSNGTITVTATLMSGSVEGQTMSCIVRCNLTDGTDSSDVSLSGDYSLSTYDATMTREGEYFQLTVSSATSDTVPSHTWTSADTDVCYVDEFGVVYAVGNGTTTVSTTVDGQYLQCIVRVNISD